MPAATTDDAPLTVVLVHGAFAPEEGERLGDGVRR